MAWATVRAGCAGTRCGDLLGRYQLLNRRMQEETRATFEDFEASIDRDSARHTVGSPCPAPASCCYAKARQRSARRSAHLSALTLSPSFSLDLSTTSQVVSRMMFCQRSRDGCGGVKIPGCGDAGGGWDGAPAHRVQPLIPEAPVHVRVIHQRPVPQLERTLGAGHACHVPPPPPPAPSLRHVSRVLPDRLSPADEVAPGRTSLHEAMGRRGGRQP